MNESLLVKADFGWIDKPDFEKHTWNPCLRSEWLRFFEPKVSIAKMSDEDSIQYFSRDELSAYAKNVFDFLIPGGYFRIAVPDKNNPGFFSQFIYNPNSLFQKFFISSKFKRKIQNFYDLDSLSQILEEIGFIIRPLEYFDENGNFVKNNHWDIKGDLIEHQSGNWRKIRFLIVDAVKP